MGKPSANLPQTQARTQVKRRSQFLTVHTILYAYILLGQFPRNIFTLGFIFCLPRLKKNLIPQSVGGGSRSPSDGGVRNLLRCATENVCRLPFTWKRKVLKVRSKLCACSPSILRREGSVIKHSYSCFAGILGNKLRSIYLTVASYMRVLNLPPPGP